MAKSDIITGLDMGSSRVTCVLAEHDAESEKIRILAGASVPCKGLKGGVVVNIVETQRAIANVMEAAEEKAKEIVGEVYLGVRGGHIQTFNNRGRRLQRHRKRQGYTDTVRPRDPACDPPGFFSGSPARRA